MRIALIGPVYPYRGGIAHYTTGLYRSFRQAGHDILLISFSRQYPSWLFPGKTDKDPSDAYLRVPEAHYWIDSLNPLTWLRTFSRIRRFKPDKLILQWWSVYWTLVWSTLGLLNHLLLRVPLIYICHNVVHHEEHPLISFFSRWALHWGDIYMVQSDSEEAQLIDLIPRIRKNGQILVHTLPVYDLFLSSAMSKHSARQSLTLPDTARILLFFGFVRSYKGLKELLGALPLVRDAVPEVKLIIAGEFWDDKEDYMALIRKLGVEDSVIVDDRYIPNEEIGVYFSAADCLVAPYRSVTGSAVVQMARSFNLPVIATRVGGLAELATEPDIIPVEPMDVPALANAIIAYLYQLPASSDRGDFHTFTHECDSAFQDDSVSQAWMELADLLVHVKVGP